MTARRSLRILVVDDDPAMVGAITALVGLEGHQVVPAYDGLTAVKRFAEERPDIVLLDLAMPGPDGFTVAGLMRAVGTAPILVGSGESGETAKVRAAQIGGEGAQPAPGGASRRTTGPPGGNAPPSRIRTSSGSSRTSRASAARSWRPGGRRSSRSGAWATGSRARVGGGTR